METKFSMLSDSSKQFLQHYSTNPGIARIRDNFEGCSLLIVLAEKEPVAFIAYNIFDKGASCEIHRLESLDSTQSREFKKQFDVYPFRYLLETLVRKGIVSFSYGKLLPPGKRIVERALKSKLVEKSLVKSLKITSMWKKSAFARKIIK